MVRGLADCSNTVLVPGVARLGQVAVEWLSGINSAANQTGLVLGAPLGGVLLTFLQPPYVLLIDGARFLVAAALVAFGVPRSVQDPAPDAPPATIDAGGYLARRRSGFTYLRRDRLLLTLLATLAPFIFPAFREMDDPAADSGAESVTAADGDLDRPKGD